ncbi:N-alpha-acetyltransferase 38-B, NatC auxiliary subunit [Elysia marginata]|uniref:N-alpha-acetyltransferase 38-B, NatC auxiliary subunit n=1 Tax=Elysia marginata TaxID=1093978 RepID=A0AAV4J6A0_9GAST|nr:N-alpha-acetyltransferase 38-B, NatC auxiliary subunit [Elysia marginata]
MLLNGFVQQSKLNLEIYENGNGQLFNSSIVVLKQFYYLQNLTGLGGSEVRPERQKLENWLNKSMRIRMTDGRTLVGVFLCTDCDCNIIVGSCEEYLRPPDSEPKEDPRILGLAMIPGKHIVSIEIDETGCPQDSSCLDRSEAASSSSCFDHPDDIDFVV